MNQKEILQQKQQHFRHTSQNQFKSKSTCHLILSNSIQMKIPLNSR